jgi:hypothetical protein
MKARGINKWEILRSPFEPFIIIGNDDSLDNPKHDGHQTIPNKIREVSFEEASEYAKSINAIYFELSADSERNCEATYC